MCAKCAPSKQLPGHQSKEAVILLLRYYKRQQGSRNVGAAGHDADIKWRLVDLACALHNWNTVTVLHTD